MKRILALLTLGAVLIVGLTNLAIAAEKPKGPQGQMSSSATTGEAGPADSSPIDTAGTPKAPGTPNAGDNVTAGSGK